MKTLKTTIEVITGYHADGTHYMQLKDIITEPEDWMDEEYLEALHRAEVAYAKLIPEEKEEVEAEIFVRKHMIKAGVEPQF